MCCSKIAFVVLSLLFATPAAVATNIEYAAPFREANIICQTPDYLCSDNYDIIWLVNSVVLTNSEEEKRDIVVRNMSDNGTVAHCLSSSVLTITALPINDNITIGCIAAKGITISYFDEITFKIRGVSPVRSLMLDFYHVNNSVTISWLPPAYNSSDHSSGLIDYQVSVFDETGIFRFYNATTTTFIQLLNLTECDTFNVSVAAILGQYVSDENTLKNNGSYGVVLKDSRCIWNQIEFILDYSPLHCPSFLSITDVSMNKISKIQTIWDENYINYTLLPFEHYNFIVDVINLNNEIKDSLPIEIYTYNVQSLSLNMSQSGLYTEVKCLYCMPPKVNQSSCCVKFSDAQGVEKTIYMAGLGSKRVILSNGSYTVTTYDLVNGSCIGPAFETRDWDVHYVIYTSSATSSLGGSQVIDLYFIPASIFAVYACC